MNADDKKETLSVMEFISRTAAKKTFKVSDKDLTSLTPHIGSDANRVVYLKRDVEALALEKYGVEDASAIPVRATSHVAMKRQASVESMAQQLPPTCRAGYKSQCADYLRNGQGGKRFLKSQLNLWAAVHLDDSEDEYEEVDEGEYEPPSKKVKT